MEQTSRFTQALVKALYALDEPWRERFLVLTANRSAWQWGERVPERADLITWLEGSFILRQYTLRLLRGWIGAELCLDVNAPSRSS